MSKKRPAPSAALAVRREREATMRHISTVLRYGRQGYAEADLAREAALSGLWEWIRQRVTRDRDRKAGK